MESRIQDPRFPLCRVELANTERSLQSPGPIFVPRVQGFGGDPRRAASAQVEGPDPEGETLSASPPQTVSHPSQLPVGARQTSPNAWAVDSNNGPFPSFFKLQVGVEVSSGLECSTKMSEGAQAAVAWLGIVLQSEGSPVRFLVRARAWVASLVPGSGYVRETPG